MVTIYKNDKNNTWITLPFINDNYVVLYNWIDVW